MDEHRITLDSDRGRRPFRGSCSCGRWEVTGCTTAGMVHGMHGEHIDAERAAQLADLEPEDDEDLAA